MLVLVCVAHVLLLFHIPFIKGKKRPAKRKWSAQCQPTRSLTPRSVCQFWNFDKYFEKSANES